MNSTLPKPDSLQPYQQSVEELVAALSSDAVRGLSASEAKTRLERDGRNEIREKPPTPAWRRFLAQFADVLVILLLVAAAISGVLWAIERDSNLPYEALAITAVVLLNAVMGYVQESRAESAVAALRQMVKANAGVVRDGERQSIAAADVVCGDLILIEEGDTLPADARLIESNSLHMAEAPLTGESVPVEKTTATIEEETGLGDRLNMVWSGTGASSGRGQAIVTATGMQTEMGRIAELLEEAPEEPTPLQKELDHLGKVLGAVVVAIAVVMIITLVVVGNVRTTTQFLEILILGVALAVAAVPEGLPAVVTTVLSLGVSRMAKRGAIVRHLAAVETLGSATVIASDKTGTLTKNEMTVRAVVTASGRVNLEGAGYEPKGEVSVEGGGALEGALREELKRALTVAHRANNAQLQEKDGVWTVQGDPTEGALLVAARKIGLEHGALAERLERVAEVPFSSERKLMSTYHTDTEKEHRLLVFTKGAPDVLLSRCTREMVGAEPKPLSEARRADILRQNELLAEQALRTLGVAARELPRDALDGHSADEGIEHELIFVGCIGMIDPPRAEAKQAVERARAAGIRPLMITGDHPKTAAVIARELGITDDGRVVTGAELGKMSDQQLQKTALEVSVYARVDPQHKLRIVRALQSGGAVVAMTGDGVNDAPALKTANIGVAMGITGTDVSKEAADIVLTDDNFATIVAAVEEGRGVYANIRKFLRFLLSSNLGEVMTMFFGVLLANQLGLPREGNAVVLPLLATQILWINLVTDGAPALALGVDPADEGLMSRAPRPPAEGVVTGAMWANIAFSGAIMATGTLLMLDWSLPGGFIKGEGTLRYAQTMAFTTLVLFQLFNVFNARSADKSAFHGLFRNRYLWGALALSVGLQIAVVTVPFLQSAFSTLPLSLSDWARCVGVASSVLWLSELLKIALRVTSAKPEATQNPALQL